MPLTIRLNDHDTNTFRLGAELAPGINVAGVLAKNQCIRCVATDFIKQKAIRASTLLATIRHKQLEVVLLKCMRTLSCLTSVITFTVRRIG